MDFRFPDVGEGIHEGELVRWLVKEGDTVKEHQAIAEVETDKAVVELPSPTSGKVTKLHIKPGQVMKVGQVIATIGGPAQVEETAPTKKAAKNVTMLSEVKEVEEAPAEDTSEEGKPAKKAVKKPARGVSIVGEITAGEEILPAPGEEKAEQVEKRVKALPAVRKIAAEKGIDLSSIKGTGPGGRITKDDLLGGAAAPTKGAPAEKTSTLTGPKVSFDSYGKIIRIPLRGIRKATAKKMSESWSNIPHVTHIDEADITDLVKVREKEKKEAMKKHGVKLTYLPYVTKACIAALRSFRYLNSMLDDETGEIITKQYFNIGFAVDTPDGLIVPVVKNCDQKSMITIADEMRLLAEQARERKLQLEDLKGGTFTITNIGTLGGLVFTPIINHPEVAILGTGRIYQKPLAINGKVKVRYVLPLGLSFDHRVVDGALAAKFMNKIIEQLENPKLIIRGKEKGLTN